MAYKAVVASSLILAGAEHVKLTYTDCGSSSTHAKITGLKPDAIDVPGKASIIGSGTLDSDQTSAHFKLKVTKAGIPFFSGQGDICEDTSFKLPLGTGSFAVKGLDCPVKAGNVGVEVDLDILSDLFEDGENSLLSIHIDADADDTGDQVLCLDVDASLAAEDGALATVLGANVSGYPACDFNTCASLAGAGLSGYPATCYASKACGSMDCSHSYEVKDKNHFCNYAAKDRYNKCKSECNNAATKSDWVNDCKHGCNYWQGSGDCSASSTSGDWVAHEVIQAEVSYTYQHGTAKKHDESKSKEWSQSVTTTVSTKFEFASASVSNEIGHKTVDSYSNEWSSNSLSSYQVTFKDKDDGKQLWQYVINIKDSCTHTEKTFTRDYALTAGKWQKPCCPAGYGANGHTTDYQSCHAPAKKAKWCSSDAEYFTLV